MVSPEHQRLVNSLARRLESKLIRIQAIHMAGTTQYFDQQYRRLPRPGKYGGSIPDLVGVDVIGKIHLGEAETNVYAENTRVQLINFSKWVTSNAGVLHVIVPLNMKPQMISRIQRIGLGNRLGVSIRVWSYG